MKTVLVIDDDHGTRNLFRLVLTPLGYQVVMAANGGEAQAALQTQAFTLIITDMHLPDSNGLKLAALARATNPTSHIVMATIDDDADMIAQAFQAGCTVYLIKPYKVDHMIELVRHLEQTDKTVHLLSDRLGLHEYQ